MNHIKQIAAAFVAIGCGAASSAAQAQYLPELKFSGFGTLGAAHSTEKNADFVSSILQPKGVGYSRSTSIEPDSKLAGQVNAVFNDQFSAVVQVISKHQYDNSFTPNVEWANVKFQATPELSVRAGRIALPTYLLSETRFVDYASPWVRPPIEVYGAVPVTSNDGVDASYRSQLFGANNTLQAYYGKSTTNVGGGKARTSPSWGFNDSVDVGSLTFRLGYNSIKLDLDVPLLGGLLTGLTNFASAAGAVPFPPFQSAAAQALGLANKYKLNGMSVSIAALGVSYDPGDYFVMSEFVSFKGAGLISDSRSWYLSGGYRFGAFTPYATYSRTKAHFDLEPGISGVAGTPLAAGAAALNAGINLTQQSTSGSQNDASVGLRWDFMKNVALKGQYDRIQTLSGTSGRLVNAQPNYRSGGLSLFSLALDFVF